MTAFFQGPAGQLGLPNTWLAAQTFNAGITLGTPLPIGSGGTGSATQNFVDLSTVQASIGGAKTFSGTLTAPTVVVNTRITLASVASSYQNTTAATIYGTTSGGSYPFTSNGYLVLEPRNSGAALDVVVIGSGGVVAHKLHNNGSYTPSAQINVKSFTVATLPSAGTAGGFIYVSDESGGATPAFSDGTNWRRVADRAIVS